MNDPGVFVKGICCYGNLQFVLCTEKFVLLLTASVRRRRSSAQIYDVTKRERLHKKTSQFVDK